MWIGSVIKMWNDVDEFYFETLENIQAYQNQI